MLPINWPARLPLARLPTPLVVLKRFSVAGKKIWFKRDDLTGFTCSGNKVRKLEFVLAKAQALGATRIITCGGLQSNHCRATAFACAELGFKCHLVLREGAASQGGNLLLDRIAGADICTYPPPVYGPKLPALLEEWRQHYEALGERSMVVPTGASDGIGIWGYALAAQELLADFNREGIAPKYVVCATGSGGTQAGLALGFAMAGAAVEVVGVAVCDDAAYFNAKVAADIAHWQALNPNAHLVNEPVFHSLDAYVGAGYAKVGKDDLALILALAREEGVLLDPVYTGKAFLGLVTELQEGRLCGSEDIVFVHTGGGFGVFPYEAQLAAML